VACNCGSRNRSTAGQAANSGTYVVTVNGRQVYESSNADAAKTVAGRFDSAEITGPDGVKLA